MTYAFITEWMNKEDAAKFDRDLLEHPAAAGRREAQQEMRALMGVFSLAGAGGGFG